MAVSGNCAACSMAGIRQAAHNGRFVNLPGVVPFAGRAAMSVVAAILRGVVQWAQFEQEEPEFAAEVRKRFTAARHHVLATLRADGSPRVSGTEVDFQHGHVQFGSMLGARKAQDLRRDGRCAIHANPGDGSMAEPDAKISGIATEVDDPAAKEPMQSPDGEPMDYHLFRLDLTEAVLTKPEGNLLVIRSWRPGKGIRRFTRT